MRVKLYQCGGEKSIAEYPLGLGYLASNAGGEIVHNRADLKDCDMIGLSSNAHGLKEAVDIVTHTDIPVIIGGQGTMWEGLDQYPFKHIVLGEGEWVLKSVLAGESWDSLYLRWPLLHSLDDFKFPERGKCGATVPMVTSRGCPYHCHFCSSHAFWKHARFHSAGYVLAEIQNIHNRYPKATMLYIQDDLFIAKKGRLREIRGGWKWQDRFQIKVMIRSDLFDEETARMLKDMRAERVRFGAESGSNRVLKALGKTTTVEMNQRAVDIAAKVGLNITASFMYDCPGETPEDKQLTQQFIARNRGKLTVEGRYKFVAFPGTALYDGRDPLTCDMRVRSA